MRLDDYLDDYCQGEEDKSLAVEVVVGEEAVTVEEVVEVSDCLRLVPLPYVRTERNRMGGVVDSPCVDSSQIDLQEVVEGRTALWPS